MKNIYKNSCGFTLIEVVMVIIVIGIVGAMALNTMKVSLDDKRRIDTKREMETLARAIVGDPALTQGGTRSDFGYVGDIGAFPPNIQALYQNPGGYATWDGPYLPAGFTRDTADFKIDEWGTVYSYGGGITITSTGGGSTLTRKIADATSDYLVNTLNGTIRDVNDSAPGPIYKDSVDIVMTIPNGGGSITSRTCSPDSFGAFTLDSLPAGVHPLRIIYIPDTDTLLRYVTILPRHKGDKMYRFASDYFGGTGGGCSGPGYVILRPDGPGTTAQLITSGCSVNWQCVDESSPDGDGTYVRSSGGSYKTDTYSMTDSTVDACNISKVTAYARAQQITIFFTGHVKPVIRVGGTDYEGAQQTVTGSYTDYSSEWNSNPATGTAWTWSEITSLEAGVSLQTTSPIFTVHCTQVWIEVDYGP
jgi:prepilin-type N-terminal cleavage/methylation domain-containing protein